MLEVLGNTEFSFQMWSLFTLIVVALIFYANENVPMEVTSVATLVLLLLFFHFFPILDQNDNNLLGAERLLHGFANTALLTVLALLVVGQGMARTGVLEIVARYILRISFGKLWLAVLIALLAVLFISAFLNNIPVVVIFIPILQGIAQRFKVPASKLLMPLSFVAVVGGMTTLVGSGTNLLVSSALIEAGYEEFSFFEFTVPGLVLALTGLIYVMLVAPKLLPNRTTLSHRLRERSGQHYIVELAVSADSELIGETITAGDMPGLTGVKLHMIHRQGTTILPPFRNQRVYDGDVLAVSASRDNLRETLNRDVGLHQIGSHFDAQSEHASSDQIVVELMIPPSSAMVGQAVDKARFEARNNCYILGVQRHAHMIRSRMGQVKLLAGDMLLVQCAAEKLHDICDDLDVVLVELSIEELPNRNKILAAVLTFASVVLMAASGLVPIVIAAIFGALMMIITKVITLPQAVRAIDPKIVTTIVTALALGTAMQVTGGAAYLAELVLLATGDSGPEVVLSVFFILVACLANIVSTKTCAVLFTPIGLSLALQIGLDPRIFAVTVVFAANCAFATPFAYQTSLLVMGPGSYQFKDFLKVGSPVVIIIWIVFSLIAPWYYGI